MRHAKAVACDGSGPAAGGYAVSMTSMTDPRVLRGTAAAVAAARVALGVVAIPRPERVTRPWVGRERSTLPAVRVLGRALGGRDLVLGVGALAGLAASDNRALPWLAAGGFADAVDAAATFLAWRHLSRGGRWLVAGVTVGATAASVAVCAGLAPAGSGER